MSEKKLTPISALGEFGLINHLTQKFALQNASSVLGVGDDAAVLDNRDGLTLVSTDMLLEAIHFDLAYTPLKHLGYKAVVVNLSDIYAMNGKPRQITVSMALSSRFTVEALDELYEGIEKACAFYNVDLVGGDTTSSQKGMFLSLTAIGTVAEDKVVHRNTAQVGDIICVTGNLGGAYMGLQVLEREKSVFLDSPEMQPELENYQYVVGRILKPEARRDIIDLFATMEVKPTAMMDISDGLSSELFHICKQSGVGALLQEIDVPIHQQTQDTALEMKLPPITCALNGGEDYELVFTMKPDDFNKIKGMLDIVAIGKIMDENEGLFLQSMGKEKHALQAQGWQHLS